MLQYNHDRNRNFQYHGTRDNVHPRSNFWLVRLLPSLALALYGAREKEAWPMVGLPALRQKNSLVRQYSDYFLAGPPRKMPQLPQKNWHRRLPIRGRHGDRLSDAGLGLSLADFG